MTVWTWTPRWPALHKTVPIASCQGVTNTKLLHKKVANTLESYISVSNVRDRHTYRQTKRTGTTTVHMPFLFLTLMIKGSHVSVCIILEGKCKSLWGEHSLICIMNPEVGKAI